MRCHRVQPQLCREFTEADIFPERIEPGIDHNREQFKATVLKGFTQPAISFIGFAEREMDGRQFKRRHVALRGEIAQFLQDSNGLLFLSGERKRPGESGVHSRASRR